MYDLWKNNLLDFTKKIRICQVFNAHTKTKLTKNEFFKFKY